MSEEMPASDKNLKQLIEGAQVTFQGTRETRHGVQPWQKHHCIAKELMRKIQKKRGICMSILDRFQNDEVFLQASYNTTGRKNGANIWITSNHSIFRTKPLQNNRNDALRCIIFGTIRNKWREDP